MSTMTDQTIALVGDCMLTRPISVYREEGFLRIRELLARADVVFANFESNVHAYLDDPFAQRLGGGSYVTTEPSLLADLKWLGINLVASGSSHADDYGPKGILDTLKYLDAAGIVHAGSGRHLAEARAPAFLETAGGRVALVAASAQFRLRAGDQRYDNAGSPGVNGFRHKTVYRVDRATLEQLRAIGKTIGWEAHRERLRFQGDAGLAADAGETYNFLGQSFEVGPEFGFATLPHKRDLEENLRQVRYARDSADRVIVSFHCHDFGGPTLMTAQRRTAIDDLADYAIAFGRQCIDAGADIFVVHGQQVPLAVEIYKGRPLLHGLGTFVFQVEAARYLPAEAYERYGLGERATPADFTEARYQGGTRGHAGDPLQWEQVFATCSFAGTELRDIRLYPIDLGFGRPRTQRGRPILADAETGERILRRVQRLSAKYGSAVEIEDAIGVVRSG
jgi:poly-gamma-glutamate capsule biosynthesis protein CapA/YwtB (metallophosphatase superfamily)